MAGFVPRFAREARERRSAGLPTGKSRRADGEAAIAQRAVQS